MFTGVSSEPRERLRSMAAVAALHLALGYAFLAGLGVEIVPKASEPLRMVEIMPMPEPPEIVAAVRQEAQSEDEEGAPSAENLHSQPTEIMAPLPEIALPEPPPIVLAPVVASGADSDAGASDRPGPGTGAGGIGNGFGSGGSGRGSGSGMGSEARLIRGRITNGDYPRSAVVDGAGGNVITRLTVDPDGRVSHCVVSRSSGRPDLDESTCRLILRRFRFEPAHDLEGRAIASTFGWQQRWWLEAE